jgi:DNA-directed RNA polymerase alpha subunit
MRTKTRAKIQELGLSNRVWRMLYTRHRIDYIDQIESMTDEELLSLQEIGVGAVQEIRESLKKWSRNNGKK